MFEVTIIRENDQKASASCVCGGFDITSSPGDTYNKSAAHIREEHKGNGGVKVSKE